ncbi:MAG: hypothetical protein HJJLKODD_00819 [Phycisphaerae bacterium]|nr:hypothetical protein [Phycisphaerae bacterium]
MALARAWPEFESSSYFYNSRTTNINRPLLYQPSVTIITPWPCFRSARSEVVYFVEKIPRRFYNINTRQLYRGVTMIQCSLCEFCQQGLNGDVYFSCDPFSNIKEPECLTKWQLLKLNSLLDFQERLHETYQRLAPMQEKLFAYMEREIKDQEDTESWKRSLDDDEEDDFQA